MFTSWAGKVNEVKQVRPEELLARVERFFGGLEDLHVSYIGQRDEFKEKQQTHHAWHASIKAAVTSKMILWFHRCMVLPLESDVPMPDTEAGKLE